MTPALQLRELRKSFGGLPAMNGVSLDVMRENAGSSSAERSGKTTLFNLITGDLRAIPARSTCSARRCRA